MTTSTLLISQHNEVLKNITTQLDETAADTSKKKSGIRAVQKMIRSSIHLENDWDDFKTHFENVHPNFFLNLGNPHPKLTQTDYKHCAYIRMKLNTRVVRLDYQLLS